MQFYSFPLQFANNIGPEGLSVGRTSISGRVLLAVGRGRITSTSLASHRKAQLCDSADADGEYDDGPGQRGGEECH